MATPVHQHAEVEACLKDILNAVKGEEVRGSIYDAIQLIDQRSIALENEIRDSVEDIADEAVAKVINSFDLIYTFDSYGGITCNRTFTDIGDIMFSAGGKSPTYYIIAPNENTPKAAIGETVLAMVTPGDEFYESYIYTITETGLYSNITTINEYHIKHYQDRITFTDKTFQVQPKLTPGNNITIDETDPEHPVINSTGGGGGSAESFVININDIPPAPLYINKTFNEIITQIGQDYGLIRVFLNYKDGYFNRKVEGIISHYESYGQEAHIQFRFNISNDKNNTIRYYLLELDNEFSLEDEYTQENQAKLTDGDAIDITNNVISVSPKTNGGITVDSNGVSVDTSKIQAKLTPGTNITIDNTDPANPVISSTGGGSSYTAGVGIDIDSNNKISTFKIKIAHLNASGTPTINHTWAEISNAVEVYGSIPCYLYYSHGSVMCDSVTGAYTAGNTAIIIKFTCIYGNTIELRKYTLMSDGTFTMTERTTTNYQPKLTAGTGISIDPTTNTISLDLPQAEGGGF